MDPQSPAAIRAQPEGESKGRAKAPKGDGLGPPVHAPGGVFDCLVANKLGRAPFKLPAAIAAAVSVTSTHAITIATDAVATISVNGRRADTTIRAADQSYALNVRNWGKWGERHCRCGSCCSKAAECSKPNKRRFEFHGFLLWNLEHVTR